MLQVKRKQAKSRQLLGAAVFGILVLPVFPANSTIVSTSIASIMADENNGLKIYLKPLTPISAAGCRTNMDWPFVIDTSTEVGRRLYSVALSAYLAKNNVVLRGNDSCNLHPGVETLYRIEAN